MDQPIHLILSPGIRIVTRNDANRMGGGQIIPAGAVAVITDSPADAQHAYKVRFNDGVEAMLRRTEFSILKKFKNDEAVGRNSSRADANFQDWQLFVIYRCVVGSQAFGLSDDNSTWTAAAFTSRPPTSTVTSTACPSRLRTTTRRKPTENSRNSSSCPQSHSEHPRIPPLQDRRKINQSNWEGLCSVGMVEAERTAGDKTTVQRRYYLTSLPLDVETFTRAMRGH